jgi:hypothetical protein
VTRPTLAPTSRDENGVCGEKVLVVVAVRFGEWRVVEVYFVCCGGLAKHAREIP